jgi:general secretion pathway protein D
MKCPAACAATRGFPAIAIALLVGCASPVMNVAPNHVPVPEPVAAGSIPAPVQLPAILPRPKAVPKPETYSVVVNNVRVQELLFALARDAKINVDIHPGITGVVTLNAIDQTLPQLLSRIARQTDMRWELNGPNLVVTPDVPFLRIYRVDYLNMDRTSNSTVSVSGNVGGSTGGGGSAGGGGSNTSSTTVVNRSENHFWKTLVDNLKALLQETDKILPAGATASATPVPAAPAASPSPASGSQSVASPAPPPPNPGPTFREAASVIANSEAGVLSIRASARQHEKVQEFLDHVLLSAKRQVLIEATIVEVALNNKFERGIDWSILSRSTRGISLSQTAVANSTNSGLVTGTVLDPSSGLGNLSATLRLLESFGDVRVLSSPKLSVLNNQTALLRVVKDLVYFKVDSTTTGGTATSGPTVSVNTTANTVAVGFVMSVMPQISDNDTVMLNLRPSLTSANEFAIDPNPLLTIQNRIPIVERREMESMIKVNNGQIAVMGGLIKDELTDTTNSIPGIGRIPGLGTLLEQKIRTNAKSELVVFLRPVIVKDPSIDGDYRAFRSLLPDESFLNRPNPSRPPTLQ